MFHAYGGGGDGCVGVSVLGMENDKAGEFGSDISSKDLTGAVTEDNAE